MSDQYKEGFQAGLETKWSSKKAGLRRAVIEAARALYYAWMRQTKEPGVVGPLNRLFDTLEALDKAEVGDE